MADTNRDFFRNVCFWVFVIPIAMLMLPVFFILRRFERRQWPLSVDEAVDKLLHDLTPDDLRLLQSHDADIDWYSFGQGIRNSYGLWEGNVALLESCGVVDDPVPADAASGVIIAALRQRLADTDDLRTSH